MIMKQTAILKKWISVHPEKRREWYVLNVNISGEIWAIFTSGEREV